MSKDPKEPMNPRVRATIYGMAALYVAYLYYQIAKPFLTHEPYGPSTLQFVLGTLILGVGAVVLSVLAWRMYKTPLPEISPEEDTAEEEQEPLEEESLPQDHSGGEEEKTGE